MSQPSKIGCSAKQDRFVGRFSMPYEADLRTMDHADYRLFM